MVSQLYCSSVSGDTNAVSALQDVFRYNDEADGNLRFAAEASVTGAAYEVLYVDAEAEIRFVPFHRKRLFLFDAPGRT